MGCSSPLKKVHARRLNAAVISNVSPSEQAVISLNSVHRNYICHSFSPQKSSSLVQPCPEPMFAISFIAHGNSSSAQGHVPRTTAHQKDHRVRQLWYLSCTGVPHLLCTTFHSILICLDWPKLGSTARMQKCLCRGKAQQR